MKLLLIRHGKTAGNLEKRYIGTTDEPLCAEGMAALKECCFPRCEILVSSPLLRCKQTAEILFPGQPAVICDEFRECDFGDFEGKNHTELNGSPEYQSWIDSSGQMPFPNGEAPLDFRRRCCDGFRNLTETYQTAESIAMVVHGGTIMSLLAHFAVPGRSFYDWMTDNAHGWLCAYENRKITVLEKL